MGYVRDILLLFLPLAFRLTCCSGLTAEWAGYTKQKRWIATPLATVGQSFSQPESHTANDSPGRFLPTRGVHGDGILVPSPPHRRRLHTHPHPSPH